MMNKIVNKIKNDIILNDLRSFFKDYEVYLVGGYLRDAYFNIDSHDRDLIIADKDAKEFAKELALKTDAFFVELDKSFGIYRVVLKDKTNVFDVANITSAKEQETSISSDIKRRDFTINSLVYDLNNDKFIDEVNSIEDLQNGIIRTFDIKNLSEDPLRMLRSYRFLSTFGLEISPDVESFTINNAKLIQTVSKERIQQELIKLFEGKFAHKALLKMADSKLLDEIFPFVKDIRKIPSNTHHHLNLLEHSIETVKQIEKITNENLIDKSKTSLLKLSGFCHDIGKPSTWKIEPDTQRHRFIGHEEAGANLIKPYLKDLKFSKKQIEYVSKLVKNHIYPSALVYQNDLTQNAKMRFFRKLEPDVEDVICLAMADRLSARGIAVSAEIIEKNISNLTNLMQEYKKIKPTLKPLEKLLSGNEVMEILNIPQGKQLGDIIKKLQEAQLDGNIASREDAVKFIKKNK